MTKTRKKKIYALSEKLIKIVIKAGEKEDMSMDEALYSLTLTAYKLAIDGNEITRDGENAYKKAILLEPFANKKAREMIKSQEQRNIGSMFQ